MLKHPNIVRLYDVKKMNNVIFMVMELCDEKVITSFNSILVSQWISQGLKGYY